jgi:nucleoid-associated protein YgaU
MRVEAGRVHATAIPLLMTAGLLVRSLAGTAAATPAAQASGSLDRLVAAGASVAALGCLAWLAAAGAAAVLATLPGRVGSVADTVADRLAPQFVRRAAGALTGAAVLIGPAAPAFAASDAPTRAGSTSTAVTAGAATPTSAAARDAVPGSTAYAATLPLPDRPAPAPAVATAPPGGRTPHRAAAAVLPSLRPQLQKPRAEVVVMRGDTLWGISARHLGPEATRAQVAAEWPRWWHANRDLIGPDPSLLLPGQVLRQP